MFCVIKFDIVDKAKIIRLRGLTMKKSLLPLLFSIAIAIALSCSKATNEQKPIFSGTADKGDRGYTYKITLEKIQFNWSIDNDNLKIKLQAQTPGWVGIGFNPTEGMKGANFILGSVKDGAATITNQHGISKTLHRKNTDLGGANRIINPSGTSNNTQTVIGFAIPYKAGDKLNKPINMNEDTTVLLAYGQSKQLAQVHSFNAKLKVNLTTGKYSVLLKSE
jgi:hypothetical protein